MEKAQVGFAFQKVELVVYGFSASHNIFYKLYSIGLLITCTIYALSFTFITVKSSNTNQDFIFSLLIAFGQNFGVVFMYWIYFKRFDLEDLFEKVKVFNEEFNNTQDNKHLLVKYEKFIAKQVYLGRAAGILTISILLLISVIRSIDKQNWVLPLGNGPAIIGNNNLKFVTQVVLFYIILSFFFVAVFLYINVITLICCYCKLLRHHILHCMNPKEKNSSMENDSHELISWEEFQLNLQYIVSYHVGITELIHQIEKVFSYFILLFYGGVIAVMCLVIYHGTIALHNTGLIKTVVIALAVYIPLIMVSIWGQRVTTESEQISAVCYEVYSTYSDLRIQKSILIMMMASCKPLTLTVGRLTAVGLRTLIDVSRSVYAYYAVIRSVYNH